MAVDNTLLSDKLKRWHKYLDEFKLPDWDELPSIGLYMEQVTELLKTYLDYLPPELKEEQFITPATINNYVRLKIIPKPRKKKYYRIHLAYIIMILTMKKGVAINMLGNVLPYDLDEDRVREIYNAYVELHKTCCTYFADEVSKISAPMLGNGNDIVLSADNQEKLIAVSAVLSGFAHLLTEKLLLL